MKDGVPGFALTGSNFAWTLPVEGIQPINVIEVDAVVKKGFGAATGVIVNVGVGAGVTINVRMGVGVAIGVRMGIDVTEGVGVIVAVAVGVEVGILKVKIAAA